MKTKVTFKDAANKAVFVSIELSNGKLSMSGTCDGGGGQCQDSIEPRTDAQKRLIEMWNEYHLNDLNAGTREQARAIKKWEAEGNEYNYDKVVEHLKSIDMHIVEHEGKPYQYGSAWITFELPTTIEEELINVIENIKLEGKEDNKELSKFANEYDYRAAKFLENTGTTFKAELIKNDFHFEGDDLKRDIYRITLQRGNRQFNFDFGQSNGAVAE